VSDERTQKNVLNVISKLREEDAFFGNNDIFIKGCVEALGGKAELATLVYPHEFPNIPPITTLKKRAQGVVSIDGSNYICASLESFSRMHPQYYFEGLQKEIEKVSEFKGQIAFKGKVTGTVKIIKNKLQMGKVGSGDILVSPMTTPDFLPAMQKAAAFVTDEGGIICHAAIVAREMKKPCIIGTKIATKVLKDGDVIEVDAEKGVVKILK
jgi:phosphoenolpyruvate synthase/pyruvate phosphate dikinase